MYHNQAIGKIGEDVSLEYLKSQGLTLVERNLNMKVSEIDLIMLDKAGITHFIEVKTGMLGGKFVFDNLSSLKRRKLARAVGIYISKFRISNFQIDFVFVSLNMQTRRAKLEVMWDQILE